MAKSWVKEVAHRAGKKVMAHAKAATASRPPSAPELIPSSTARSWMRKARS